MIHIDIPKDCGNAPNKKLLSDLIVTFLQGNNDPLWEHLNEDTVITWQGQSQSKDFFLSFEPNKWQRFVLHTILTHGRDAALHASIWDQANNQYDLTIFFVLSMGKKRMIRSIIMYCVPIENN